FAGILCCSHDQARFERTSRDYQSVAVRRSAADEVNHFEFVSLRERKGFPLLFWNNRSIALDRNAIFGQIEALQKLRDAQRLGNFTGLTIQANLDFHKRRMLAQLAVSLWERPRREWFNCSGAL